MQRQSYPTETVLSKKITRNRIVLSFKDDFMKPLGQGPKESRFVEKSACDSTADPGDYSLCRAELKG